MTTQRKAHWESIYETKAPEEFSWFQVRPELSLELIDTVAPAGGVRIIDIGGGDSRLVDELIARDSWHVGVLDISGRALERARSRLGAAASRVNWIEADVTEWDPDDAYDLWHDRAVFHFLVDAVARDAYVRTLENAVVPRGHAIIATFGPDGPEQCSGLPVARYDGRAIASVVGQSFELVEERTHVHSTPWGSTQAFRYFVFRRTG